MSTTAADWSIYWRVPVAYEYDPVGDDYYMIYGDSHGNVNTKTRCMADFWSTPIPYLLITSTATTKTLNNVVIPDLGDVSILAAYVLFSIDSIGATSANETHLNSDTTLEVDKASAGWLTAFDMVNHSLHVPASTTQTDRFAAVGSYDISSRVGNNATTNFRWVDTLSNADDLRLNGVRTGVRIITG